MGSVGRKPPKSRRGLGQGGGDGGLGDFANRIGLVSVQIRPIAVKCANFGDFILSADFPFFSAFAQIVIRSPVGFPASEHFCAVCYDAAKWLIGEFSVFRTQTTRVRITKGAFHRMCNCNIHSAKRKMVFVTLEKARRLSKKEPVALVYILNIRKSTPISVK